jgi:hypothetical protein
LQFERLEAALAAKFHRSQEVDSMAKYKISTLDRVTTELAKPRMTKSARIAELNLDTVALQNSQVSPFLEQSAKSSLRNVQAGRKRHRSPWTGTTAGIEPCALKTR